MSKLYLIRKDEDVCFVDELGNIQDFFPAADRFIARTLRDMICVYAIDDNVHIQEKVFAFKLLADNGIIEIISMFPQAFPENMHLDAYAFMERLRCISATEMAIQLNKFLGLDD